MYTLISYKPSSMVWRGCNCHGNYEHFESEIRFDQNIGESELEDAIFQRLTRQLEDGEDGFSFFVQADGRPVYTYGINSTEMTTADESEAHSRVVAAVMQRALDRAAKAKEHAIEVEKAALKRLEQETLERERKAAEDKERQQYEALKAKFGPKEDHK